MTWEQWKTYGFMERRGVALRGLAFYAGWSIADAVRQSGLCIIKYDLGRW